MSIYNLCFYGEISKNDLLIILKIHLDQATGSKFLQSLQTFLPNIGLYVPTGQAGSAVVVFPGQ